MTGITFIFFACLLWAADTLIRYPLLFGGISAQQIVLFEHLFVALAILGIFIVRKRKFNVLKRQTLVPLFVIGVLGSALGTLAFTQAFYWSNPTVVILLQKLQPLVAVSLAYGLLKEAISPRFFLWLGLALIGSLLLIAPDLLKLWADLTQSDGSASAANNQALWGYMLALFAVLSWGSATVFGKKLSNDGLDSLDMIAGRFAFGLLGMLPFALMTPTLITHVQIPTLEKVAILAMMSGLLGMYCYYQGLKRIPAHWATLAEMFFPVAAVTINWFFLDVSITPTQCLGGVTLVFASAMAQGPRWRRSARPVYDANKVSSNDYPAA
jgi:drug/metabolite transporter (DMT)-like permease